MNQQERLQKAIDNAPVPRDLEARIRTRLESTSAGMGAGWGRLLSSTALLIVMLGGIQYYVVQKTHDLLKIGVDDHIHCAIGGEYPRQTDQAEAIKALGPYSLMLQPIMDQFSGDSPVSAQLVSAHRCTVNGRNYMHVIVRSNNKLISFTMTRRDKAEGFPKAIWMRGHSGNIEGYSATGFEAGNYLGYVVSELPGQQNDQLAGRLAPVIRRYTGA